MSIQTILTWTSFLIVTSQAFQSNWNQETRDYILEIHNEKRRGENGCYMNKLVYDMALEEHAKRWAKGCVFKHELKDGRGENLAFNTFEDPEKELIKGSTQRWFDEKNIYSYGQYSCGSSCHYTQMVWWSTQKVGCYSYRCPYLGGAKNAWYLVCFYLPKANMNGEKPYEKSCAKKCKEGQTEDNGLCVGESKGGSTSGGDDDGVCDDDQGKCAQWAKNGQCKSNAQYMLKNCRKSCKVCIGKADVGSTSVGDDVGDCKDDDKKCPGWSNENDCKNTRSYVYNNCKKSCNICVRKEDCKDSDPQCEAWGKRGECKSNPGYMNINCKKSCNLCASNDEVKRVDKEVVEDVQDSCESREKKGECANNPTYMSKNCKTSCKNCLVKDSCDDLIPSCSCWAKCGACDIDPDFMTRNCKKSCKKC